MKMRKKFFLLFAILLVSILCISCNKNGLVITIFNDSLVLAQQNDRFGYLDKSGNVIIDFIFEEATSFRNGRAIVRKDGFKYLIDTDGRYVNTGGYEFMEFDKKEDVIIFGSYTCQGLMNFNGKVILKQTYNQIFDFSEGLAVVKMNSENQSRFGYINTKGRLVIDDKYLYCSPFSDGLAAVQFPDGKCGYINKKGRIVLDCIYSSVGIFEDGFAMAALNNQYVIINKSGRVVFEDKDNEIEEYNGSFISVRNRHTGLLFIYNTKGKQLSLNGFRQVCFYGEMIFCKNSSEAYVFNKKGDILFSSREEGIKYTDTLYPKENQLNNNSFSLVFKNKILSFNDGKVNSISIEDGIIIDTSYDGYFIAVKNKKYGILNSKGETIIDYMYEDIDVISNDGYVIVKVDGKYGIIDIKGKTIIEPQYRYISFGVTFN